MKGRKPKPTRMKALAGNPGRRPLNSDEPEVFPSDLAPPHDLRGLALKAWKKLAPLLARMKLFTDADRDALEMYCTAYGHWKDAEEKIREHGAVVKAPSGYIQQSPYIGIAKQMREEMRKLLPEFGLTPSSRSRLNVSAGLGKPKDEHDDFFQGPRRNENSTEAKATKTLH